MIITKKHTPPPRSLACCQPVSGRSTSTGTETTRSRYTRESRYTILLSTGTCSRADFVSSECRRTPPLTRASETASRFSSLETVSSVATRSTYTGNHGLHLRLGVVPVQNRPGNTASGKNKRKSKNDGGSHSLSFIQICLPCAAAHFQISGTLCRRRPSRPGWRRIEPGVHSQC